MSGIANTPGMFESSPGTMTISLGFKLYMFLSVLFVMALSVFLLIISILFTYALQKFYVNGHPLLNTNNGRVLYGSLVAMMICMSASAVTNNRSVISLTFMLFSIIAAIVALVHINKLKSDAVLSVLLPSGHLEVRPDETLGKMKLTNTFRVFAIVYVVISSLSWLGGMTYASSYNDDAEKFVGKIYGGQRRSYF